MPEGKVEVVRRNLARWAEGDFTSSDGFDPDLAFVVHPPFPEAGATIGFDQIGAFMQRFLAQWERYAVSVQELREAGDTVLAQVVQTGRGRSSGAAAELRSYLLFTFQGERIVRMDTLRDEDQAFAAIGLSPGSAGEDIVAIALRMCEAAWLRPTPDLETLAALGHPDHEMFTVQSMLEGGGYRGAEGFGRWLASWNEMFGEDWEATVEDARATGDERVLITGWMKARGAQGGVPIEQRFWVVMDVRDGLAVRSEVFTQRERALEAAGVAE
jgi:ketosteroid isomerase-like protein